MHSSTFFQTLLRWLLPLSNSYYLPALLYFSVVYSAQLNKHCRQLQLVAPNLPCLSHIYSYTLFLLTAFLTATPRLSSLALSTAVYSGLISSLRSSYITASVVLLSYWKLWYSSYGLPRYFPSHHCISNPRNTSHAF